MGVEKISFCSVESQSFLACSRPALIQKGNSQADLAQCQGGRTVNETSAAEEAGENRAQARNLPPAEAAWNGESWNTAAQRDHADQETKNNKRLCRLVLSKSFALARLRVAFLRALHTAHAPAHSRDMAHAARRKGVGCVGLFGNVTGNAPESVRPPSSRLPQECCGGVRMIVLGMSAQPPHVECPRNMFAARSWRHDHKHSSQTPPAHRECARQRYVDTIRKTLCLDSHDHPTGPLVATLDMLTKGEGAS